eukprot:scaffold1169_cov120-Cylindrotheca_fusiformis.AAC.38
MTSLWGLWHSNSDSKDTATRTKDDGPRHLGLSIDSDSSSSGNGSEVSSLSDFEDGMPLWAAKSAIPQTPVGFHVRLPNRGAALSLDTKLTQRSSLLKNNLSLPLLDDFRNNSSKSRVGVRLQRRTTSQEPNEHSSSLIDSDRGRIQVPRRLWKYFFMILATGFIGASINQQLYTNASVYDPTSTPENDQTPNFPSFSLQPPPLQSLSYQQNQQPPSIRRSNLALARSKRSMPIFEAAEPSVVVNSYSTTAAEQDDSWISWLGGFAFFLVLLETGWKGYRQQQQLSHESRTL